MKLSTPLTIAITASVVHSAALQPRHYTFPALADSSDWQYVRTTTNKYTNAPVTDVLSDQVRCYEETPGATTTATKSVAAGSIVTYKASQALYHQGPLQFYMAKVPAGKTAKEWDGKGVVWFKIFAEEAKITNGALNQATFSTRIPPSTPSGEYLLRIEHIALHNASPLHGAQLYISCAQINVTGGGNGVPGPLVAFPGAYNPEDPGLKVNIYSGVTSYTPPGPKVWSG